MSQDEQVIMSEPQFTSDLPVSLPRLLRILFCLNGLSLSMESLSLMYVINSRVKLPVPLLPTYGAVAFLPYSLKPLYAFLSGKTPRHLLYVCLLTASGVSVICTCFIPTGGIALAFLMALARGISDSWSELCLGLTLIDHAQRQPCDLYDSAASKYQAQAATARNGGALLANSSTFLLFLGRHFLAPDAEQLNGTVANCILITTGLMQILGALYAYFFRDDIFPSETSHTFDAVQQDDVSPELEGEFDDADQDISSPCEEAPVLRDDNSHRSYSSTDESLASSTSMNDAGRGQNMGTTVANWVLVILLQLIIMLIALRRPLVNVTSHAFWSILLGVSVLGIVSMALHLYFQNWWKHSHRAGLFLILRHAIPSDSTVWFSFVYFVFADDPLQLQMLSLVGMVMVTLGSWSYGRFLSGYRTTQNLPLVIFVTTIVAGLASMANIWVFEYQSSKMVFVIALGANALTSFFGELAFLPDVVIATTSVSAKKEEEEHDFASGIIPLPDSAERQEAMKKTAVEYGTLISCLDFGDQIGSLLAGPIVALMGISRENEFAHLDHLVLLGSFLSVLSLVFLPLLR